MLTEEQIKSIIEAAKADDAAEKLGSLVGGMLEPLVQSRADVVVAEAVAGIKSNRDEFRVDLEKYKPLGKPEEIQAGLAELATLRSTKGKKVDQEELNRLIEEGLESRVGTFRAEQEALRTGLEGDRDAEKLLAETAVATATRLHKRSLIASLAPDIRPLMRQFYDQRIEQMLHPVEAENGELWWKNDVPVFKVVDPATGAPLTGKGGGLTPGELIESGRLGLGDREWNSKEFAETFFEKKGKGANTVPADGLVTPTGHVPAGAPSYEHFEALYPTTE
ncbi:MAG: hypothetical protein O7A04_12340 [Acidobacteria bacterium]|nr:hypothetical protein [Acidobacteriota bacterium]